ncbi:hypothetical protein CMI37_00505 [Candidatus Pacearchaeota archaeon]|nr:hypothetical protein [Candidatus Pacearchaeota archaeon]
MLPIVYWKPNFMPTLNEFLLHLHATGKLPKVKSCQWCDKWFWAEHGNEEYDTNECNNASRQVRNAEYSRQFRRKCNDR